MSTVGSSSRSSTPDRRPQPRGPTRWKKEEIESDRNTLEDTRLDGSVELSCFKFPQCVRPDELVR